MTRVVIIYGLLIYCILSYLFLDLSTFTLVVTFVCSLLDVFVPLFAFPPVAVSVFGEGVT